MKNLSLLPVLLVVGWGCATTAPQGGERAPAARAKAEERREEGPMDDAGAARLVAELQASFPLKAEEVLRNPRSMEHAWRILKLDQVNLFEAGVRFTALGEGIESRALQAQMELAWGESYMVLLAVMLRLGELLEDSALQLKARERLGEREQQRLDWLQQTLHQAERWTEAFQLFSIEHFTRGSQQADDLITEHPENYLGYRVAADYYRTVRDWDNFDAMVRKIEALNPESNGLVFLRGTAAFQREGDRRKAAVHYRQALANDPDFVRAQAHLVMLQTDLKGLQREVRNLAKLNPHHQVARWVGPYIDRALEFATP